MSLHPVVAQVTERLRERSRATRAAYLERINNAIIDGPHRARLSCGNLAHGFAACNTHDKAALREGHTPNLAIVTAYNDMLSAHQPYERYPEFMREVARQSGVTAQVAGGVPAMCDGVTQGRAGMELSLFSRDLIAMTTAVALSHDMFDGALYLGICDKIVPGLLIGALSFGHLPGVFVPSGPMPSGISNEQKSKVRQAYTEGKASRDELLEAEAASYHSAGTCTFYGTANSNQMLMEIMGLHLPGSSFVAPETLLRDALTAEAVRRCAALGKAGEHLPIGHIVDERAIVNGVIGLHATGGSTNHLLHLVAIAQAAGIALRWEDFDALSSVIPLLARVYPNGYADVNHFHEAGGMGFLIDQLLSAGLLHGDARTIAGTDLSGYAKVPELDEAGQLVWKPVSKESGNRGVLRAASEPFRTDGGLRMLNGNLGRSVIKVSSVPDDRLVIEAPAVVFHDQDDIKRAFDRGELNRDFVAVVRFQGPRAIGMPELHKLTPTLAVLQDRGHRIALVTDGRMSGASGRVPAAIHVTPEADDGGPIARVQDGDIIRLDAAKGTLDVLVDAAAFAARTPAVEDLSRHQHGMGRELFGIFRRNAVAADLGAGVL
ncbi:phosphogluconate dehydratase [Dyella nitratireducens]|uniref:Phosphogluconate dehydratase n=1 Tax=Dyella nitratireducens TaxID=1849580 RepID=A0ABQ1FVU1_9GAMM|nr:phosphogluconate dehydratase [Dyella nitratireducens]GGA31563.1 phosphogluconate dehydratase [Dyella nitratireducens]GLQ42851.1 phosphogluconate dehydratase [Dyella nitratireducens]